MQPGAGTLPLAGDCVGVPRKLTRHRRHGARSHRDDRGLPVAAENLPGESKGRCCCGVRLAAHAGRVFKKCWYDDTVFVMQCGDAVANEIGQDAVSEFWYVCMAYLCAHSPSHAMCSRHISTLKSVQGRSLQVQ
jgi:hypothetical protein